MRGEAPRSPCSTDWRRGLLEGEILKLRPTPRRYRRRGAVQAVEQHMPRQDTKGHATRLGSGREEEIQHRVGKGHRGRDSQPLGTAVNNRGGKRKSGKGFHCEGICSDLDLGKVFRVIVSVKKDWG